MKRSDIRQRLFHDDGADLLQQADMLRRERMGNTVHIRGIIEFSNHCQKQCRYCGIRPCLPGVTRYRIPEHEVLQIAVHLAELNIKTLVLQSGQDPHYSTERLIPLLRKIKQATGQTITLSVGELPRDDYFRLRDAGGDRYLMRFEIADPDHYRHLHPDSTLKQRLQSIEWIREAGFQVGTGFLMGVVADPEHLVGDIELTRKLHPAMIGAGPFIATPGTPHADSGHRTFNDPDTVLRVFALLRLTNPDAHIPATTALDVISPDGRRRALQCGADVIMPNFTPHRYAQKYQLYPGKVIRDEAPAEVLRPYLDMLQELGRAWA